MQRISVILRGVTYLLEEKTNVFSGDPTWRILREGKWMASAKTFEIAKQQLLNGFSRAGASQEELKDVLQQISDQLLEINSKSGNEAAEKSDDEEEPLLESTLVKPSLNRQPEPSPKVDLEELSRVRAILRDAIRIQSEVSGREGVTAWYLLQSAESAIRACEIILSGDTTVYFEEKMNNASSSIGFARFVFEKKE